MAFEESEKCLYERAAKIESMEGTIKYSYKEDPDDSKNYTAAASKRTIALFITMFVAYVALIILGIFLKLSTLVGIAVALLVLVVVFAVFVFIGLRKNKSANKQYLDDIILSFNAYGVVFRMSSELRVAVFAYAWQDFESIVEYDKVLVGIRQNIAYIFPKRVFTEQEYNIFRRFSFAALGKKCVYKNFSN